MGIFPAAPENRSIPAKQVLESGAAFVRQTITACCSDLCGQRFVELLGHVLTQVHIHVRVLQDVRPFLSPAVRCAPVFRPIGTEYAKYLSRRRAPARFDLYSSFAHHILDFYIPLVAITRNGGEIAVAQSDGGEDMTSDRPFYQFALGCKKPYSVQ